jgi:Tol biopolymer transport system component
MRGGRAQRRRRGGLALLCLGLALAAPAGPAWAAKDDLDLVSRATGATGAKGSSGSGDAAVSADGRFVAFASDAANLHPDDTGGGFSVDDVFVRDMQTNTTTLVSRATGAAGDKGNDHSFEPAVSADGRFVAFQSDASNLHPDDDDSIRDVFVRDLEANTTTLVSRAAGADGDKADSFSFEPAVSADGRFVAFESQASNLHPDDDDGTPDVFVRDLQLNTTTLVSRATGADGDKGNSGSGGAAVSADGRFVAFHSGASNLHPDDDDGTPDVFVRDLQANTTTLVSRAAGPAGDKGNGSSGAPAVSADGRLVAFHSVASNLHPDDDGTTDVFVRDLQANTTTLASRAAGPTGAKGNSDSFVHAVSADGHFVAFSSFASNLHPDDTDLTVDVFVRDLHADTTTLVSRAAGPTGTKGNRDSFEAAVSADGRFVAFSSRATNLHPDDTADFVSDVFRRDVLGPPPAAPPLEQPSGRPARGAATLPSLLPGACANKTLGSAAGDVLAGSAAGDRLRGLAGNDRLPGLAGRDCLFGGAGADRLAGGLGRDRLLGGRGRDRIAAGPGNDRVLARGQARDTIDCGPGQNDVAIVDRLDQTRRCEQVRTP